MECPLEVTSILIFILGTLGALVFTWRFSIKARRAHGIPRFFSFECILLLVLLNVPVWFKQTLIWNQLISWILLFVSIVYAGTGFYLLRVVGKPQGDFENTSKLVVVGLYKFIRHPLYASLVLLGFGIFFKQITIETTALVLFNFFALIATAKQEEKEMLIKFGEDYQAYMKRTKMFIPYLF